MIYKNLINCVFYMSDACKNENIFKLFWQWLSMWDQKGQRAREKDKESMSPNVSESFSWRWLTLTDHCREEQASAPRKRKHLLDHSDFSKRFYHLDDVCVCMFVSEAASITYDSNCTAAERGTAGSVPSNNHGKPHVQYKIQSNQPRIIIEKNKNKTNVIPQ